MGMRLFVFRHGETGWSRERRFAGWRDVPLAAEGRRQCDAAAAALAEVPVTAVCASPLERARASAEIVAKPHRLVVEVDPAFQEMGFGDWEGLTREEVAARFPEEFERWRRSPASVVRPGGESLVAVADRVTRGLDGLRSRHDGGTVLLVTHAIVVRLLVLRALGLGPERLWTIDASPAGLSEIEFRDDDWITVHRVNTRAHLGEEPGS